ncbi:MAG: HNH endonuclease [Phycisphaerae bacterium]
MDECIDILQDLLNHANSPLNEEFFQELRNIQSSKDDVIRRFQPVFSRNLNDLDAKSYKAFLRFENNKHWTGLSRSGNSAATDMNFLKEKLKILINEKKSLAQRFDEAKQVNGLGKAIITAILLVVFPNNYGVWNNRVEKGMKNLNLWPVFPRGVSDGEKYEKLNETLLGLASKLNIDLWTLDSLWWFISIKGIKAINQQGKDEEEISFPEGRAVYRTHKFYERNSRLTQRKKQEAQEIGQLKCYICDFDFQVVYGESGKGFIECHHIVPISDYNQKTITKLEDLVLVCSNCHRILHRHRPCLSVEEMKGIILINKNRVNLC